MESSVLVDLRYALRGLLARPGFTIAIVLTFAVGIGANAAMFAVVDRLLFRDPPLLRHPEQMHRIYGLLDPNGERYTTKEFPPVLSRELVRWSSTLAGAASVSEGPEPVGSGADVVEQRVAAVSTNFFGFFDAPPALGRYFDASEDALPAGSNVVVLSDALWRSRFGARADAIGKSLEIGSVIYTVIGVTPREFAGAWAATPPVAYVPLSAYWASWKEQLPAGQRWYNTYMFFGAEMIVEAKPEVSQHQLDADLALAYARALASSAQEVGTRPPPYLANATAFAGSIIAERGGTQSSGTKVAVWTAGMAVIVWLIACANVANLLLARAMRRRREIAVRVALGVSRMRLARQLMSESLLLAGAGGIVGLVAAVASNGVLRAQFLPSDAVVGIAGDPRVLLYLGGAVLAAGVLAGIAPVLRSQRADLTRDLRVGAREGVLQKSRTRVALFVAQAALSVALLVGAGLFVRSVRNIDRTRLGYDPNGVVLYEREMRGLTLDSAARALLLQQLLRTAQATPGVREAALASTMPLARYWFYPLRVPGLDSAATQGPFIANAVTPGYFDLMRARIVRGRGITAADVAGAPAAIVITESMERRLWAKDDAIGKCIHVEKANGPCAFVVGIAADIRDEPFGEKNGSLDYWLSLAQFHPEYAELVVRVESTRAADLEAIRRSLQAVMPGESYVSAVPLASALNYQTRSWRLGARMFTLFGAIALLLAAIGLYSVMAYHVAQRAHELGVRVALGAQTRDLMRLVLGAGLGLASLGLAIGGVMAFAAGRWLRPLLYEESPHDPIVYAAAALVLLFVAAVACVLPAWRAGNADPMTALRAE